MKCMDIFSEYGLGRRFAAHGFGNLWYRHRCRDAADSLIFDVKP
jgi:hypothetical protein